MSCYLLQGDCAPTPATPPYEKALDSGLKILKVLSRTGKK